MYTKWSQVEDWIKDNGLTRWTFSLTNPNRREDKPNDKIVDSTYYGENIEDKLAMTKKALEQCGCRVFGVGFHDKDTTKEYRATTGGMFCEVELQQVGSQCMQPVGIVQQPAIDVEKLTADIRKQLQYDFDRQNLDRERKEFEQERNEYRQDKESAIGLLVNYLKPVIGALAQRRVAGLDAQQNVQAARIEPTDNDVPDPEASEPDFTEEEIDRLNELMARFKAVEPEYLNLIEAVVNMAEAGDNTYTMARSFILK